MVRERLTGEAPPEAARDGAGAGLRLDRGEGRRRSRRARPRARRPGRVRGAGRPSCCATSSWSRASPRRNADPEAGDEEGDDEAAKAATRTRARTRTGSGRGEAEIRGEQQETPATRRSDSDWSEEEMADASDGLGEEGEEGMLPVRPNRPLSDLPPSFDYRIFTDRIMTRIVEAGELCDEEELGRLRAYLDQQLVHLQGAVTKLANRLQRRLMAQQIAQLGFRPGGRAARRRAAGAGDRQPGPFALLQGRARHRVPRHGRHPADRQFGLDARAADLDRRDQRRHPRPHARALRREGRDPGLHHPRLEGRPERARNGSPTAARRSRAGSTTCATSSTRRPTSPGGGRARASA